METDLTELRATVAALTQRVETLEKTLPSPSGSPTPATGTFWALDGLTTRLPDSPSTSEGAVMMVGTLTLPTGAPVAWQETVGTAALLDVGWEDRAATFAALGHPMRLELLRQVLHGVHATADLAQIEGLGTTGQLHHHLRQLVAAGWLRQSGRGSYEVPAARIVPLLVGVLGAS